MADEDIRYDFKAEVVRRGTEARVFATMQTEGWELVREKPGLLRTQLMFRRPRPTSAGGHLAHLLTMLRTRREAQAVLLLVGIMVASLVLAIVAPALGGGSSRAVGGGGGGTLPAATSTPEPTSAATPTPGSTSTASTSKADVPLTKKNNKDFARLLKLRDPADSTVADFADDHRGDTISFNANVAALALHGDYKTRYDILLLAGDAGARPTLGPSFAFNDVNTTSDLHYRDSNIPDTIGVGDEIRVTARVEDYDSAQGILRLEPVSTVFR